MRPEDLIRTLPADIRTRFVRGLDKADFEPETAKAHLRDAVTAADLAAERNLFVNRRLAHSLANRLAMMVDRAVALDPEYQRLVAAAVDYFVDEDDADEDFATAFGLDDDAEVVGMVHEALSFAPKPTQAA